MRETRDIMEETKRNLLKDPKQALQRYDTLHREFGPSDFDKRRASEKSQMAAKPNGGKKMIKTSPRRAAVVQPVQESPFHRSY